MREIALQQQEFHGNLPALRMLNELSAQNGHKEWQLLAQPESIRFE